MTGRYRWTILVANLPFVECTVGPNEETLLWRGGFCKRIADIRSKYKEVFSGSDRVEEVRAGLVDAVRVNLVKNFN